MSNPMDMQERTRLFFLTDVLAVADEKSDHLVADMQRSLEREQGSPGLKKAVDAIQAQMEARPISTVPSQDAKEPHRGRMKQVADALQREQDWEAKIAGRALATALGTDLPPNK
jgi:hypothetical protein